MNELLEWAANQGFAIAVAAFLLVRLDQKLDKLINAVDNLTKKIGFKAESPLSADVQSHGGSPP